MPFPQFLSTPRAAVMLVFAAFGSVVGAFSGSIPAIVRQTAITSETLGLALTGLTISTIAVMAFGGALARRFSNRTLLLAALPTLALTLAAMLTARAVPVLILSMIAHGLALGVTDLIMNAEGSAVENDLNRPVFTAFHGSVSLSLALSAIASSFLTARFGPAATAATACVAVALACLAVHGAIPSRPLQTNSQRTAAKVLTVPLILLGTTAGLAIACETSRMRGRSG